MMENDFNNPIMPGADPFVFLHDGKYYMYCTIENEKKLLDHHSFNTSVGKQDGYYVYQSDDLLTWENKGLCLNKEDVKGDKWFWAPEVLHRNGKFYMVYLSEEHIGMAVADSPLGPFVLKHKGIYYLTYSANHTRCQDYAVGVAMSKSPIGPFEKFKGNPILHKNDKFCGVGIIVLLHRKMERH